MRLLETLESDADDSVWELGALGVIAGVVVGALFGLDANPFLWASVGGVFGILIGLLAAELR